MTTNVARNAGYRVSHRLRSGSDVVWSNEEPGPTICDNLLEASAPEGYDRSSGGLRFGGGHTEGFIPHGRTEHDARARHDFPENGSVDSCVHDYAGLAVPGIDILLRVIEIVWIAVEVDALAGKPGDFDSLRCALSLDSSVPRRPRQGRETPTTASAL